MNVVYLGKSNRQREGSARAVWSARQARRHLTWGGSGGADFDKGYGGLIGGFVPKSFYRKVELRIVNERHETTNFETNTVMYLLYNSSKVNAS